MSQYFYLIATLPDLPFQAPLSEEEFEEVTDTIQRNLSEKHRQAFAFLRYPEDLQQLLFAIFRQQKQWPEVQPADPGVLEAEMLQNYRQRLREMPDFLFDFVHDHSNSFDSLPEGDIELLLQQYFMEAIGKQKDTFVKQWFAFDNDLRNWTAFLQAARFGYQPEQELLPDDYLKNQLVAGRSGLDKWSMEFPWLPRLRNAVGTGDPIKITDAVDFIRRERAAELMGTAFFSAAHVFSRYLQLQVLHQRTRRTEEAGLQRLADMRQQAMPEWQQTG